MDTTLRVLLVVSLMLLAFVVGGMSGYRDGLSNAPACKPLSEYDLEIGRPA